MLPSLVINFGEPFLYLLGLGYGLGLLIGDMMRDQTLAVCGARRGADDDYPATSLETLRQMVAGIGLTLAAARRRQRHVGQAPIRVPPVRRFKSEPADRHGLASRLRASSGAAGDRRINAGDSAVGDEGN